MKNQDSKQFDQSSKSSPLKSIVLGGGCFWGVQDAYSRVRGVKSVKTGYAGGVVKNPSYRLVCSGITGHAEVVKIDYNPAEISFKELLEVFWEIHDPSQKNRQGNDVGSQYRSIILTENTEDAVEALEQINELKLREVKVTTEVKALKVFYQAEEEHQDYLQKNPNGYCHIPQRVLSSLASR